MRKHNTWWLHIASRDKTRNPKQCQMSQIENSKRASLQAVHFRDLEIWILNLFRISIFELRISKDRLDPCELRRDQDDLRRLRIEDGGLTLETFVGFLPSSICYPRSSAARKSEELLQVSDVVEDGAVVVRC